LEGKRLAIAVPASVVSDIPHLREKTSKVGLIGRAAAIFRVSQIIIYPDYPKSNQKNDMELIATLLAYMETPQYLRKRLFAIKPELQYAGVLPPLRTSHHPLNRETKNLKVGEYREGVTLSKAKTGTLADIGVERAVLIPDAQLPMGKRVTVRIAKAGAGVEAELTDRSSVPMYWGYEVAVENRPFGNMMRSRGFDLTIATSRYGAAFSDVADRIAEKSERARSMLVAFGAPSQGLNEIVKHEGLILEEVADFVVNTIPSQGTETVRTEEALVASLAILNAHGCL
jgi:predicted SPOUT superfamily RNA methylase MTH1